MASLSNNNNNNASLEQEEHTSSCSFFVHPGCFMTLLLCFLVPTAMALLIMFGVYAIPVILVVAISVSLFRPSPPSATRVAVVDDIIIRDDVELNNNNTTASQCEVMDYKLLVPQHNVQDGRCEICLVEFTVWSNRNVVASPNPACRHVFHKKCITKWLERKPTCPCCREIYLPRQTNTSEEGRHGNNDSSREEEATSISGQERNEYRMVRSNDSSDIVMVDDNDVDDEEFWA